jgi:23S rRNA (uracil1939-C5)-methyltransferase
VGRLVDGRVIFVEGGVPGDLVEPKDWIERKRMVRAGIARLIESSPDRVEPHCVHFGVCGGCRWQHVDYAAQLSAKLAIVRNALERIGGLTLDADCEIVASPQPYGYRARARLVEQEGRLGFRRRGSRQVEAIEACPVLVPAAEARRLELCESVARSYSQAEAASSKRGRRRREVEWELLTGSGDSVVCGRVGERGSARDRVELHVLGETLQASRESFVQGNALLWEALAEEVRLQALAVIGSESRAPAAFVELYAGIGFLTLPLARSGLSGVAIESSRPALRDLAANLERADLADRVEIVAGRVERRGDLAARFGRADVGVVDPPRCGLEETVRQAIARAGPGRIVYVSCDPATLARDLRFLVEEGGYRMASLRAFDLFPQTPHVELVTRLEREGSRR